MRSHHQRRGAQRSEIPGCVQKCKNENMIATRKYVFCTCNVRIWFGNSRLGLAKHDEDFVREGVNFLRRT